MTPTHEVRSTGERPRTAAAPRARVLVVDDEAELRETMELMLHRQYDVRTARDGVSRLVGRLAQERGVDEARARGLELRDEGREAGRFVGEGVLRRRKVERAGRAGDVGRARRVHGDRGAVGRKPRQLPSRRTVGRKRRNEQIPGVAEDGGRRAEVRRA